jgi:hypothetical protein
LRRAHALRRQSAHLEAQARQRIGQRALGLDARACGLGQQLFGEHDIDHGRQTRAQLVALVAQRFVVEHLGGARFAQRVDGVAQLVVRRRHAVAQSARDVEQQGLRRRPLR